MKNQKPLKLVPFTPQETIKEAVVPKPTKNEIIEAMARVRFAEVKEIREKAEAESKKRLAEIQEKIKKFVIKNIRTLKIDVKSGNFYSNTLNYVEAEIPITNALPEDLRQELISWHKKELPRYANLKEIKNEIREGMGNSPIGMEARINALITNPKTKSALEKMLLEIGVGENSKAIAA